MGKVPPSPLGLNPRLFFFSAPLRRPVPSHPFDHHQPTHPPAGVTCCWHRRAAWRRWAQMAPWSMGPAFSPPLCFSFFNRQASEWALVVLVPVWWRPRSHLAAPLSPPSSCLQAYCPIPVEARAASSKLRRPAGRQAWPNGPAASPCRADDGAVSLAGPTGVRGITAPWPPCSWNGPGWR